MNRNFNLRRYSQEGINKEDGDGGGAGAGATQGSEAGGDQSWGGGKDGEGGDANDVVGWCRSTPDDTGLTALGCSA
jgi:hypothetical protein